MRKGSSRKMKKIHLSPWTELCGKLLGISTNDYLVNVKIGDRVISFQHGSHEAKLVKQNLVKLVGKKVGVLKTDLPEKPLVIRVLK